MTHWCRVAWLGVVMVAACSKRGDGPGTAPPQSFDAAMAVVCASDEEIGIAAVAPAERAAARSRWIDTRLTSVEVRGLFARLGDLTAAARGQELATWAGRAGLSRCMGMSLAQLAGSAGVPAEVALAALAGPGTEAVAGAGVLVIVTADAIVVDGEPVVALRDFAADDAALKGGARGLELTRLAQVAAALAQAAGADEPVRLALHPQTPYRLVIQVMFSLKIGGVTGFGLLGRVDGVVAAVPVALPARQPPADPSQPVPAAEPPISMVVSLTARELAVWSISGVEGTLTRPALTRPLVDDGFDLTALRGALVDVVRRRWPDGARAPDDEHIVIMADAALPVRQVLPVLAAVRPSPGEAGLFPALLLSSGFE